MTVREQFLSDVITTAIEGGIGYWSVCLQYQYEGNVVVIDGKDYGGGTRATISPLDTDDIWHVTPDTIARGISVIREREDFCRLAIRDTILAASRENDGGEIDADGADVIVQAALFGELVYG